MPSADGRTTVIVAVCTYNRNEPLACLLEALIKCAAYVRDSVAIGVVIVDDTSHGGAREVSERFADRFELGITYRVSGKANISVARNMAIETAMGLADWTAMTDDDCEPVAEWIDAMLDVQRRTGGDAVTGIMVGRAPPGSPKWITDEPFLDFGAVQLPDASVMDTAYTNNSLISSTWLISHPNVRFDPNLGKLGGEDMVFFRTARSLGLKIYFSKFGFVYENEPPSRITLSYQLRRALWNGNTSYVTSTRSGVRSIRMLVHGIGSFVRASMHPFRRLFQAKTPQLRYSLFLMFRASGVMLGFFGVKLQHR